MKTLVSMALGAAVMIVSAQASFAFVVKEETRGVNVYRNVKSFTSSHVQDVRTKTVVGRTGLPQAQYVLHEEEVLRCNRRLRVANAGALYSFGKAGYCQ